MSAAGRTPGGATGGASSWSSPSGGGGRGECGRARRAAAAGAFPRAAPFGPPPAFAGFAALAAGLTFGTGLGGGTGFLPAPPRARTRCGPRRAPTRVASAPPRPGRPAPRRPSPPSAPSRRSRRPARRGAPRAAPRRCRSRPLRRVTASAPASSALTAAFPAERCNASNPGGPRGTAVVGPSPALGEGVVAPGRERSPASPARRPSVEPRRAGRHRGTARHATFRARPPARKGTPPGAVTPPHDDACESSRPSIGAASALPASGRRFARRPIRISPGTIVEG